MGTGEDVTVAELASLVAGVVGYQGRIDWDVSLPNGMPRKLLDTTKLTGLGWTPTIDLADGVASTYEWFVAQRGAVRG